MPNAKNVIGKGRKFSSTNQPENRGRKPSLYRQLIRSCEVEGQPLPSREDFYKVVAFLLERTRAELQEIKDLPDTPIWVQSIIGAIFEDLSCGRITVLNTLFDRLFGKATQVAEVKADIYKPRTLTKEEVKEYMKWLNETY